MTIFYSIENIDGWFMVSFERVKSEISRGFSISVRTKNMRFYVLVKWEKFKIKKLPPVGEIKCGSYYGVKI